MTTTGEQARARAVRALDKVDVGALFSRFRAVIGPPPEEMSALAQAALAALANGREPTARQLQALETAIRLLRPAPLVQRGTVADLDPEAATAFPGWPAFQAAVTPFLPGIGRVDRTADAGFDADEVGTGFLVSPTRLVTNRHVVDLLTMGTGKLAPGQAVVRFGQELGVAPDPRPVPVLNVAAIHPDLDLAVLELEAGPDRRPLVVRSQPADVGTPVAAVGYPAEDGRSPLFVTPLFGGTFGVKRAAPGEVTGVKAATMFHDCSTLGGNSGSPILAMDTAELLAVHSDGLFLARNKAVTGRSALDFLRHHATAP